VFGAEAEERGQHPHSATSSTNGQWRRGWRARTRHIDADKSGLGALIEALPLGKEMHAAMGSEIFGASYVFAEEAGGMRTGLLG